MTKYNLDKLIKVQVQDFTLDIYYSYRPKKTFLGFEIQKEGVYHTFYDDNYFGPEAPKTHTLKDGVVYQNPTVILYFQDDNEIHRSFNTLSAAKEYAKKFTVPEEKWYERKS